MHHVWRLVLQTTEGYLHDLNLAHTSEVHVTVDSKFFQHLRGPFGHHYRARCRKPHCVQNSTDHVFFTAPEMNKIRFGLICSTDRAVSPICIKTWHNIMGL